MNEFWHDTADLAIATAIAPLLAPLPGLALLGLGERFGWARRGGWDSAAIASLLGIAILPALDALLCRIVGIGPVAILHLLGGLCGMAYATRLRWRFAPGYCAVALLWWLLVLISAADIGTSHGLNQSLVVVDLVKHAAVTEALVRDGLPLTDPEIDPRIRPTSPSRSQ